MIKCLNLHSETKERALNMSRKKKELPVYREIEIQDVAAEGKALVLFSQGFYIRPKLDAEKEAVAKKHGDVFVNMEDVRSRKDTHGRYNHPGDLGMELIAERFWQHIEKRVRDVRR